MKMLIRLVAVGLVVAGAAVYTAATRLQPPLRCFADRIRNSHADLVKYCTKSAAELEQLRSLYQQQADGLRGQIAKMESDFNAKMMELTAEQRVRREAAVIQEPPELGEARFQLVSAQAEIGDIQRAQRLAALPIVRDAGAVAAAGVALILLTLIRIPAWGGGPPARFLRDVVHREVQEYKRSEQAVALLSSLSVHRRDAVAELWHVRPRVCGYCGATLPAVPAGAVEKVRIFKQIPDDAAKAKPIQLGVGFRPIPPESVACKKCGHGHRGA